MTDTSGKDVDPRTLARAVGANLPSIEARTRTWTGDDGRPVLGFEQACISHYQHGRHIVVTLAGELGVYEAPTLRGQLGDLIDHAGGDLVVDLRAVDFLDSTSLGVLVWALQRLRDRPGGRTLHVVADQAAGPVDRVLRTLGLTSVFQLCDSVAKALHAATTAPTGACPPTTPRHENGASRHA